MNPELTRDHFEVQCNECRVTLPVPAQEASNGLQMTIGNTAHLTSCALFKMRTMQTTIAKLPIGGESKLVSKGRFTIRRVA